MSIICSTWVVGQLMHPPRLLFSNTLTLGEKIKILHYWGQRYIKATSGKKDLIVEASDPGFTNSSQSTWLSNTIAIMEWFVC